MSVAAKKKKTDPTKTVLVISLGFVFIYIVGKARWEAEPTWALWVALGIGLAGLLSSYLAEKIDYLWMKLAWVLGLIVPNILLSAIFFLFLFPIALLSRLFGAKDPLFLKNQTNSTYRETNKEFDKASFEKPW